MGLRCHRFEIRGLEGWINLIVWQGRRIGVDLLSDDNGEGVSRTFEVVRFGQGVAILPLLDMDRVVLIRQFRPAVGETVLEIPAGKIEAGEDVLEAAARELHEEVGISEATMRPLTSIWTTPGFCDEVIHIVMARGGILGESCPEEDEWIEERVILSWDDVRTSMAEGKIRDSKTLVALSWGLLFLGKGEGGEEGS
jgi:ADP-ribose pyrophosphatase